MSSSQTGQHHNIVFPAHGRENNMQANPNQRVSRRSRDNGKDNGFPHQCAHWFGMTDLCFMQGSRYYYFFFASHASEKEMQANPNQRVSRRRRDKRREYGLPHQCEHWLAMTDWGEAAEDSHQRGPRAYPSSKDQLISSSSACITSGQLY